MKKNKYKDSDEYGSLKFNCPVCDGIHRRPYGELLTHCPSKRDQNGKEIPIPKC